MFSHFTEKKTKQKKTKDKKKLKTSDGLTYNVWMGSYKWIFSDPS